MSQQNWSVWCECGNRKVSGRQACARCKLLDGGDIGEAEVIWLLRAGPSSIGAMAGALGVTADGLSQILRRLTARGRVCKLGDWDAVYRLVEPAEVAA